LALQGPDPVVLVVDGDEQHARFLWFGRFGGRDLDSAGVARAGGGRSRDTATSIEERSLPEAVVFGPRLVGQC
jgi:hypothetical protein